MPILTGPDMKTLREGLLLSAQALAERFKAAGLVPVGNVRTVQRWEEGARPVPDDIAHYIQSIDSLVSNAARELWRTIVDEAHTAKMDAQPAPLVAMVRYEEDEHCPVLEHLGPGPHHHRLHCAMLGRLRYDLWRSKDGPLHLVVFNPEAFNLWRRQHNLTPPRDTPEARNQWAAFQCRLDLGLAFAGAPESQTVEAWAATHGRKPHAKR